MGWEMEMDELEAVLEKIWDLHDKLSDAILAITRSHYLHSLKSLRKSDAAVLASSGNKAGDDLRAGFVFVKDFPVDDDYSAVQEAKSLKAIRTALENLEDQLEFFHTVQVQQRAERDAAIARLEQSRIILSMRLAEHHGKKYKVIEEALAFVGDVRNAGRFVSPDNLNGSAPFRPGEDFAPCEGRRSSNLIKFLISGFEFAKKSLKIDQMGGILGNAALVAISMLGLLHLHQVPYQGEQVLEVPGEQEDAAGHNTSGRKVSSWLEDSSTGHLTNLDVMLARG